MPLRSEFCQLLAHPCPESWRNIVRLLNDARINDQQHAIDVLALGVELKEWPPEIARPPAKEWVGNPRLYRLELALCQSVREVDLYREYIDAAAQAPALRLRDGTPAVRLERQFTGALQGGAGRMHKVGKKGQADLAGSLCLEWSEECGGCLTCRSVFDTSISMTGTRRCTAGRHWHRLAVALAVEVKTAAGAMDATQATRQDALRRRGEISICVKTTAEMVRALVAARDNLLKTLGATP